MQRVGEASVDEARVDEASVDEASVVSNGLECPFDGVP